MGKHSAPRTTVVPARLAMLSTATLIGLAVSANGGAGQAIADDTSSTVSGDGVWVTPPKQAVAAPPKQAVAAVVPASYQHQARAEQVAPIVRAERVAPVSSKRPMHRADRPTAKPGKATKPGGAAKPGGTPKPGGTAPLATIVDSLNTGSAALPPPLRAVLEDLAKQVGPVLAKGLLQLINSGNLPSSNAPAPTAPSPKVPSPKARHAAPAPAAPAAAADEDDDEDTGGVDSVGVLGNHGGAGNTDATDNTDVRDSSEVPDDDADWTPLALGPSTNG
ncbi:hypothetical protein OG203_15095 [Nocardia sp. NBC_01499]|uniref:hypothetical protein n=1 Tax=Nocardia sp. NBC_01499 TaxID=2903597 RepID=UPI0038647407